jgi:hypothetical protein
MLIITCETEDDRIYYYAILEEHETYEAAVATVGEEVDDTIAYYFEHDEPIIFDDVHVVAITDIDKVEVVK